MFSSCTRFLQPTARTYRTARFMSSVAYQRDDPEPIFDELEPMQIVDYLDRYVVGQQEAKNTLAISLRNRWRRKQLPAELRKEVIPKNILMIGKSGVGKTELARRVAQLSGTPFIKAEATKFTEVGYKGQDVDVIVKDLLDNAITIVKERDIKKYGPLISEKTEQKLLQLLMGEQVGNDDEEFRQSILGMLRAGLLEDVIIEYPTNKSSSRRAILGALSGLVPKSKEKEKEKLSIAEIRAFEEENAKKSVINNADTIKRAIHLTEEYGIAFIDEIDKLVSNERGSPDASSEGVQRDLLPLIEGTKVRTDHGEVDTSYILFICAGAFLQIKPADLLAELQGRLPVRAKLAEITEEDMYRILIEPETNIILQQRALLHTEGVDLRFTDDSLREIARISLELNRTVENIGARRLYTVVEKVMEDISYNASDYANQVVVIDKELVEEIYTKAFGEKTDLKHYII